MPTCLYENLGKKRITKVFWSKDWASKTPWKDERGVTKYFDRTFVDHSEVHLTTYYLGPIAIIDGRWVK